MSSPSTSRRWFVSSVAVLIALAVGSPLTLAQRDLGKPIGTLPKKLPTSKIKQDGKMMAVKTTAKKLTESTTRPCRECRGDGKVKTRAIRGSGAQRPGKEQCQPCRGEGRVPNEPEKVQLAAIAVATAITRMAPDATGADVALQEAYDAITEIVLKNQKFYRALQKQGTFALSQSKPPVDKIVMFKAAFAQEVDHPTKKGEKVYVMRVPGKKLAVAVVSPKHAEVPPEGGRTLVAGAIAGAVDVDGERVVLLEHGFVTSPTPDNGWWANEW